MHLILGIGNPGGEYARTRHNIGWMVVEALAARHGSGWQRQRRWQAETAEVRQGGQRTLLVKPQTYVNRSGSCAQALCAFHKIPPERLLVVVDDINLPFGHLRLRDQGSSGGHNGLKDIEAHLGRAYHRLRLGIGAPQGDQVDHVLGIFAPEEQADLGPFIAKAATCCEAWLVRGVEAGQEFNGHLRPPPPKASTQDEGEGESSSADRAPP